MLTRRRRAAAHAPAQFTLGADVRRRRARRPADQAQAAHWFRKAAIEQGDAQAEVALRDAARDGRRRRAGRRSRAALFEKAAERGDRDGAVEHRRVARGGPRRAPEEPAEASNGGRKPPSRDSRSRRRSSASRSSKGEGTRRDLVEGYAWLSASDTPEASAVGRRAGTSSCRARRSDARQAARRRAARAAREAGPGLAGTPPTAV